MISATAASAIGAMTLLWFTPAQPASIPLSDWTSQVGDHFIVDTAENRGYLLRADNSLYTEFPVITGQKRIVTYISRTYNAETPNWHWVVKSKHIKGDRTTFGPTGRFLRLYKDGEDYTSYGIHEHRSEVRMFGEVDRYQSMGCIIVQSAVLDVVERTYELNGEMLDVVTQTGVGPDTIAQEMGERLSARAGNSPSGKGVRE